MPTSSAPHPPDSDSPRVVEPTTSGAPDTGSIHTPRGSPSTAQQSFDDLPAAPARWFGRYRILAELARGGMGIVYQVRDSRLDREVALKVLRSGEFARPEELERFDREARAVAKLNHPNIVPLFDVGTCDGQVYFTMELARAGSLAAHRPRLQADRRAAVALLVKVARALAQIHARGFLHRDLKPANILLRDDETPLISDFGLAKAIGVDTDLTRTGAAVGTPSYMAPEQAAIEPDRVGPATDIWSLGVIAYELLCGVRPFASTDERRLIDAIINHPPPAPRRARPGLDRDLETILLKCLEKDPAQRYASAAALADDLEAWQLDQPIKARPASLVRRTSRWARRHSIVAAVLGLLAIVAVALPFLRPEPDFAANPAVQAIQDELAHLRPVTLIGTGAERPACQWIGKGSFRSVPEDGALQIVADKRALLLLLPDPVVPAYRFEGELRVDSYPDGVAGLFVGHSAQDTPGGRLYSQVAATVHHEEHQAPMELQPRFILSQFFVHWPEGGADRGPAERFAPRKKSADGWHHIAVDVDAKENMRMTIQNEDFVWLSAAERMELATLMAKDRRKKARVNAVVPTYAPRSGLGLYFHEGTFSVRNVKITPKLIQAGE